MEERSNRINFVISWGKTNSRRHTENDSGQICINGVKKLTKHGFLPPFLYLFSFFLSPHFFLFWLCIIAVISFIFVFFFLSTLFPYLPAAGLRLKNVHFPFFFFVCCPCLLLSLNITMCTYILEGRISRCFNLE